VLVAQNHPKGMLLTRILRFELVLCRPGTKTFLCVFVFFWRKTTRVRKMFVFCETLIKSGCLSLMSLSGSIRSSIVSDNKDDNDDDTRGEKELRPPRILAAV
jgi:hypothetical protein